MPTEYYRAAKVEAFMGVRRADLDALLFAAGGPDLLAQHSDLLAAGTEDEPYTVEVEDGDDFLAGSDLPPADPVRIFAFDVVQLQIDAGLNEIPRATVRLPVGRSGSDLVEGATDAAAIAPGHLIERYLGTNRLPAKIYCRFTTTASAGVGDLFDNLPWADEWVVLFDGAITHTSRRGTGSSASLVAHLSHFADNLTFSSTLTGQAAAGPFVPHAFSALRFVPPAPTANILPPSVTPHGAGALAIGGSMALYVDFWGYRIPADVSGPGQTPLTYAAVGLKGWLTGLADHDQFAWESLTRADMGGTACGVNPPAPTYNGRARSVLNRIEPIWPTPDAAADGARWDVLYKAVTKIVADRRAAGSTAGVTRFDINTASAAAKKAYADSGYLYGMPSAFYLDHGSMGPFASGRSFASNVLGASFPALASSSFWQLMVGPYASDFQLCVPTMASRLLVVPFQPLRQGYWQSVAGSEIFSWEDAAGNPVPTRGVILIGDFASAAGAFPGGNKAASPDAQSRYQQLSAGFDGCDDGVFEFRAMPPWLINMWLPAEAYGAATLNPARRAMAAAPRAMAAASAVGDVLAAVGGGVLGGAVARLALDVKAEAAKAPPPYVASTASRLAKALWQMDRTKNNTYYVTTRFRYDIGPGSAVRVELPADKYVGPAAPDLAAKGLVGTVVRVTIAIDNSDPDGSASTSLQVGFVRTDAQAGELSKLYADSHPFWATTWMGAPWADARWIRARLGDDDSIIPNDLNPG